MNGIRTWIRVATDPSTAKQSLLTCLVVGSLLTAINHGEDLLRGRFLVDMAWQIALTFLVPLLVSTTSSVAAIQRQRTGGIQEYVLLEREIKAINKFPDRNPNPVLRVATDGRLTYANPAGAPIRQALNVNVGDPFPADILTRLRRAREEPPDEVIEVQGDGRTYSLTPVLIPEFGFTNIYGTDITAMKAMNKFPDQNPNPVLRVSQDGRLEYANPASALVKKALGVDVGGRLSPDLFVRIQAMAGSATPDTLEVQSDGRIFELLVVSVYEFGFINLYGTDVTAAREVEEANRENERLLLNILPASIARRLRQGETVIADRFDEMTVLFADCVGFTQLSARLSPAEVVECLNDVFSIFDRLADRYGLEKIKTIGDAYMVVGGLTPSSADHVERVADMALDMITEVARRRERSDDGLEIRVGMHVGPTVAGVIGLKKFIYDVWGDTVNTASRMETLGLPGRIHVTEATYDRLKDSFAFESRGILDVKGKGPLSTYFLDGRKAGVGSIAR